MTKQTIIPVGYRITVTTMENDGDSTGTEVLEGLSKEATAFYMAFIAPFRKSQWQGGLGNIYAATFEQRMKFINHIRDTLNAHANYTYGHYSIAPGELDDSDAVESNFGDILNDFGIRGGTEYYTRVVEVVKVEYIPTEIVLEDVTEQFE